MNKKIFVLPTVGAIMILSAYLLYAVVNIPPQSLGEVPGGENSSILGVASTTDLTIDNQISQIVENSDGSFDINYVYTVNNIGLSRIYDIKVINDLQKSFSPYNFTIKSVQSDKLTLNGSFNGTTNKQLLAGSDSLQSGQNGKVFLTIKLSSEGSTGPFENFVEVAGLIEGPEEEDRQEEGESEQENTSQNNNNQSNDDDEEEEDQDENKKPNKEPKLDTCPAGYKEVTKGKSQVKNEKNKNKHTTKFKFPKEHLGKFKLGVATKEGNPDNPSCTASGKNNGNPKCSENEDFESFTVKLDDEEVFKYNDNKNPDKENWWFKNWTTKKLKETKDKEYTLTFEHVGLGNGKQDADFKFILCAQTEPDEPKPTNTVVPTQQQNNNDDDSDDSESESEQEESEEEQFDSAAYNSASVVFTLIKKVTDVIGGDGEAVVDDSDNDSNNATPTPTEQEGEVIGEDDSNEEPDDETEEEVTPTDTESPEDNGEVDSNDDETTNEPVKPTAVYTAVTSNSYSDSVKTVQGQVLGGATTNQNNVSGSGSLQDTGIEVESTSLIGVSFVLFAFIAYFISNKNHNSVL